MQTQTSMSENTSDELSELNNICLVDVPGAVNVRAAKRMKHWLSYNYNAVKGTLGSGTHEQYAGAD